MAVSDVDIFRAANLMIKRYGKEGALDAASCSGRGANWP